MISTVIKNAGAGTVTPPAVGLCSPISAGQIVRKAPLAALYDGTGLPIAGTATPVRLRGLIAAAGMTGIRTGAFLGATVRPSVQTTAQWDFPVVDVPTEHPSTTPGDLPPEDPLS